MGNASCHAAFPLDDLPKNTFLGQVTPGSDETTVLRREGFEDSLVLSEFCRGGVSISTELELFRWAVGEFGSRDFLGTRDSSGKYVWRSYEDVYTLGQACCTGLYRAQFVPRRSYDHVGYDAAKELRCLGIFFRNREEWYILEQAANNGDLCLVPFYDSLSPDAVVYIIKQTKLNCIAVDATTAGVVLDALESLPDEGWPLTSLVLLDRVPKSLIKRAKAFGLRLLGFTRLLELGGLPWTYCNAQHDSNDEQCCTWETESKPEINPPSPSCVQTICFTSGTTGRPKGALGTHSMHVSAALGCLNSVFENENLALTPEDVHLSYLPLAHSFERLMTRLAVLHGMRIGIYSGSPKQIVSDLAELQPTVIVSVPRLLQKIFDGVVSSIEAAGPVASSLFRQALSTKIRQIRNERNHRHGFWDQMLFTKIKDRVSKRLKLILSGAAPLDLALKEKLQAVFSVHILEGYGLTETVGCVSIRVPFDGLDHLGALIPSLEMKLQSAPELDYFVTCVSSSGEPRPQGEVLVRGHSVSPGYFVDAEETAKSFVDGWFHTGDIGMVEDGVLKIIDRRKNIFKLSQGEYIVPERLEQQLSNCRIIDSAFIAGRSTENCLVALIVLDQAYVKQLSFMDRATFQENVDAHREELERITWREIREVEDAFKVKGFERVKRFLILDKPFGDYDAELLTPTLKLRRHLVARRFQTEIDDLYSSLREAKVL